MRLKSHDASSILSMISSLGIKGSGVKKRDKVTEVIPTPSVVPPSQYFEGVDGLAWGLYDKGDSEGRSQQLCYVCTFNNTISTS